MLSLLELPSLLYPCHDLYELTLQFGGEHESLPQSCIPSQAAKPLETSATARP